MKPVIILALFIFTSLSCFSQQLEGEWKGSFTNNNSDTKYPIALYFNLTKDSTYNIFSYSKGADYPGQDILVVCQVSYKIISNDSIYLEETKILKPKKMKSANLQKMFFKIITNGELIKLQGTWQEVSNESREFGTITLTRK
jgi:hypothetical protein